jgi:two-component system nitrogen regulation sensor histidine kinase NtrY
MPGSLDSPSWAPSAPEVRRRRREAWIIAGIMVAVVLLAVVQFRLPQSLGSGSLGTDAVLIALIDLNLILLVLLVFLVGRNIAKLIFERRRRIMGSHLRTRLVGAFVAIALLPATLLFLVALVFVNNSIERWFNGQVESSLEGSLEVAHTYYEDLASTALGFARQLASRLAAEGLLGRDRQDALKHFIGQRRVEYQLDMVEVFAHGHALARTRREDLPGRIGVDPATDLITRAGNGSEATLVDPVGEADMIRAAAPVQVDGKTIAVVVVDAYVPKSVVKRREQSERAFNEYVRLRIQRRPIQTNYTITLAVVTIVVLFSATWFGFFLARGITVPIQRLAEGTRAVAQGDLDHRIEGEGEDEIGTLVGAFNRMTAELKTSRTELESRRRYLETVLANVTAGVVSADAEGRLTTMNRAAESLLGMSAADSLGRRIDEVFAGDAYADVRELAAELRDDVRFAGGNGAARRGVFEPGDGGGAVERQLKLHREAQEVAVLLTGSRLLARGFGPRGLVLFFEDVTHLLRVQRMEAWREVARRIAHEIKNPLTPIQLSAQRLRRRYAAQLGEGGAVFDECTRTIIQQVEELKALVNEFATFARMPAGAHTPQDLNRIVEEALVLFREGHRDITFVFDPAAELPEIELDREGIKRAIINLLDNAVAACTARRVPGAEPACVELRTTHDTSLGVVRFEVADNGPGMSPDVKARLFEPYFSTKPDGTGLGLAIVSAIVADHSGFIRVRDNLPRGSRFVMELPVRRRPVQLAVQAQHGAYAGAS